MGKSRRERREEERESFAAKRTSQKRSVTLKAVGILSIVAAISAYASYEFITMGGDVPGAPENAGKCNNCKEELYLREDDNPATIQQRLNVYHKQTEPVIKYYSNQGLTKIIDSKGTIDEIRSNILINITT